MSRYFTSRNIRRVARSLFQNQKTCLEVYYGQYLGDSQHSMYRYFSSCSFPVNGKVSLLLFKSKHNLMRSDGQRKLCSFSLCKTNSGGAQVVWKKISQICSHNGAPLPPISQIARAVSFALARSNLVAPSVVAFLIGEFAWTRQTWAEAQSFPTKDTIYMHAFTDPVHFTSIVVLLLEGCMLLLRAIYLAILFLPCIIMAPFVDSFGAEIRKEWLGNVHRTLEKAGPAFIKWGQWAATRPDLFPRDLCAELAKLHTNAPSHSFTYTRKSIEQAFGRKLPEIFEKFEEDPVASGSVAQVHRATLKYRYPGQQIKPITVAVKVRHPGVADAIRRDFVLINFVAKFSRFFPNLKWLRLDESLQQFAVFMMSQVDLSREAAHLSRFIYNFRRWKDVSFPKPLYPLVHPSVLVETYEQGESVLNYIDGLKEHEPQKTALAHIGTHALLKMLLVDNFIHADMHPGNILVREVPTKLLHKRLSKSKPHVIFLDVGMTTELSKKDRLNLLEFFKAVAIQDGRAAAECMLRLSKEQRCPNPRVFIEEVEGTFNLWHQVVMRPADYMQQMLEQVRRHKVNIDGSVCSVMVTTLVLEGWQRKLDPEYNVLHTLQTLLFKADWAESLHYIIEGLVAP